MTPSQGMMNPPAHAVEEGERPIGEGAAPAAGASTAHRGSGGGGQGPGRGRPAVLAFIARLIVGLLIIAAALAIAAVLMANRRQALQSPLEETVRRVRAIEIVPIQAETVARRWEGFGTARARIQADVAAEVGGRVVMRPARIDPGVAISAGELLVRLDEADYRERMQAAQSVSRALSAQVEGLDVEHERIGEQVEQAREQIRLASWEIDRLEEARAGAAATELELQRLRASLSRLESERLRLQQQLDAIPTRRAALLAEVAARRNEAAVAERQLERTSVVSPISGIVQAIDVHVGENVQAGQRVARVVDLSRIEIPLRLPAGAQGDIRAGDWATVHAGGTGVMSGRDQSWRARVARIAPEVDAQSRTITVFLEVEQQAPESGSAQADWSGLLMPGRFVSGDLNARAGNGQEVIAVPRRAVIDDRIWLAVPDQNGERRAQPRPVRVLYHVEASIALLEENESQWAVIGSGVEAGELVIVTNLDELTPGVRVDVVGRE
jgi:RND family efflux transporter MFP subunit